MQVSKRCIALALGIFLKSSIVFAGENYNALYIPPLIDMKEANTDEPLRIEIREGQHEFVPGIKSETKGYNGHYLGPTLRNYANQPTKIDFVNTLSEPTTVHGHGLHIPGNIDGGPQSKIDAQSVWSVTYPNVQQASTNWYHPHLKGSTSSQVHAGLAGFYLIEDENSLSLNLPNTYGIDDIPLAIQDRTFIDGKMKPYPKKQPKDLREPTLIVNGTLNPELKVPASLVRFRLLNASNGRSYELRLSDDLPFKVIGTEGGFLESAVSVTSLKMSPGERYDVVVDMTDQKEVDVIAKYLPIKYHSIFVASLAFAKSYPMLRLEVDESLPAKVKSLPEKLNEIDFYQVKESQVERLFDIGEMDINGSLMDMSVINFEAKKDTLELWTIDGARHPFHMHGTSFQIVSRNGKPPSPEERGWKDVVYPNGVVQILLKFSHTASEQYPYMYHCHILEHEDMGMMGQFVVTE